MATDTAHKQGTDTTSKAYHNKLVTWGRQYDNAIHAEMVSTGEPVRLIQPANVENMSPTFLCVRLLDGNTKSNLEFVTLDQVRITDPNFLPTRINPR